MNEPCKCAGKSVLSRRNSKYRGLEAVAELAHFQDRNDLREAGPELEQHRAERGRSKWCRASRSLYFYSSQELRGLTYILTGSLWLVSRIDHRNTVVEAWRPTGSPLQEATERR